MSGEILIQNLPGEGMIKATVVGYGYQGAERDWYPTPGQSVAITIPMSLGQGGFTCPGYTPSNLRTLDVTVMDGFNRVAGAYVCVWGGLSTIVLTPTRQTSTRGQVSFTGLPEGQTWNVIASLGGKRARVDLALPHVRDTAIVVPLVTGTVPRCGGAPSAPPPVPPAPAPVSVSGTVITPIAPLLPEEALAWHGDSGAPGNSKYTCRKFGPNYVVAGLRVNHQVTHLTGLDLYCAPLRSDGTLGVPVFYPLTATPGGTVVAATCPSGQAVTGVQGTNDDRSRASVMIRSLQIHCRQILPTGLATGVSVRRSPALGIVSGPAWGPNMCTQNRPASAIEFHHNNLVLVPGIRASEVWSFRLFCEQPARGQ